MWIKLTPQNLKDVLAVQEQVALAHIQKPFEVDEILKSECHNVANIWRSKIRLFHSIDSRDDYVPESLLGWILIHLRYVSFTRLPNMDSLLDNLRVREYDKAMNVLDNLKKYSIDDPDDTDEECISSVPVIIVENDSWKF